MPALKNLKSRIVNGKSVLTYLQLFLISVVSMLAVVGVYFLASRFVNGNFPAGILRSTRPKDILYRRDETGNVMVTWKTASPSLGMVIYGKTENSLVKPVMSSSEGNQNTEHLLIITESPQEEVYFKIFSGGVLYGLGEKPFKAERVTP